MKRAFKPRDGKYPSDLTNAQWQILRRLIPGRRGRGRPVASHELERIFGLMHRRRHELQRAAVSLGARAFAERPPPLIRRFGVFWSTWKQDPGRPPIDPGIDHRETPQRDVAETPSRPAAFAP